MNPEQITELIKVIFFGVGSLCIPVATAYVIIGAARARRAEEQSMRNAAHIQTVSTQIDGLLVARDAANVKEGERAATAVSDREAATLARGQQEGRDNERARADHALPELAARSDAPIPVADDRTATAVEKSADAAVRSAEATERVADATEKKN